MSLSNKFPTINPSLNLDLANTKVLDPRVTFTRASSANRTNANGLIEIVSNNTPRFDYDPVTGVCKGLLIEEQRTNLLTYSEQFNNAAWSGSTTTTVATNTITAPDGTVTADKIIPDTDTEVHFRQQTYSGFTSGTAYTVSVFAKAGEYSTLQIYVTSAAFDVALYANFNLSSGTVTSYAGSGTTASITAVGNGWHRCSVTAVATATASAVVVFLPYQSSNPARASLSTGDGTSGIYIWGAQLEQGSYPTSYIKTEAAQVTRVADVATMTGTNFSSWYNSSEGTLYAEAYLSFATGKVSYVANIMDGVTPGTVNSISCIRGSGTIFSNSVYVSNSAVAELSTTPGVNGSIYKSAIAYKANDFASSVNGGAVGTDTSGAIPSVTQMNIGGYQGDGTLTMNGSIKRIAYFPKRLSNTELQGITT